jgi:hypothetical protein
MVKLVKELVFCVVNSNFPSNGYKSPFLSTSPTGNPVIGTSQTLYCISTGIYYVSSSTSTAGCTSIKEEINLIPFGNTITNLLHDQLQIKWFVPIMERTCLIFFFV